MEKPYFEGWYFKHQKGDDMIAFIPGKADSGAFVQMIAPTGSRFFCNARANTSGWMHSGRKLYFFFCRV